ncbi:protein-disulfide reductase DsbD family protein [Novosphingobium aquiterrae]|uniref:Protein-disulfide reductase DsbD family protein n=1 Tax=Novosphingobium aquiterrae TaxID=624388 RepID=A0ABV6PN33_9SPHN
MLASAPAIARAAPNHIAAEVVAESAVEPGKSVTIAVLMRPEPGWHGYWANPGDAGLGMEIDWSLPPGVKAGALRYPVPDTLLIAGLMNHVFEHDYAVLVDLTVPAAARPGTVLPIKGKARWLACTDKICVPESGDLATTVTVGATGVRDPRFDAWRAAQPAPLGSPARFALGSDRLRLAIPLPQSVRLDDPHVFVATERSVDYAAVQTFSRAGDLLLIELPRAKFDPLVPTTINAVLRMNPQGDGLAITASPGHVPSGGMPLQAGAPGAPLWSLLLSALLGGLLLNVMPCVFPILSLKALSLVRSGESAAQARSEGLAYSAGVVLACVALGVLLLALRAAGEQVGWAFQLQEPLVVAALLLVAVTITANLAGLFEFAVPGFARSGSPQGAFATGLLAAFVATPCTGPFMAAAMGAALLLPVPQALALFAALGLGLALPFLALAFIPVLRRALPRPGAWMERFRKAMAVPMGLTALALVWLASRVAGNAFALAAVLTALIVLAALVLLGRRQRHGLGAGARWWLVVAIVLGFAALGLPGMVRAPAGEAQGILSSQPYSEAALAQAREQGKPVFLYFTADWCLTCKVNEAAAIEREETRAAFTKAGVVVLRGDWTRRDPAITRYLATQGAAGVPLYMWYPAEGGAPQQLPQVLSVGTLTDLVR